MSLESYNLAISNGVVESTMPFDVWEKKHRDIISVFNVPGEDGEHFARVIICTINSIVKLNVEFGPGNPERYTKPVIHQLVKQLIYSYKTAIGCPYTGIILDIINCENVTNNTWEERASEVDEWYSNWKERN